MTRANATSIVYGIFAENARVTERLSISEWADRYRTLSSRGSAEPGPWRTSRTPYLREIMDCLSPDSPVQRVWFMKGAQIGATEVGANWIGYAIDCVPGPMLFVQPTLDGVKRAVKQRIDPLIEENPQLREKLPPKRSKDGGNSLFEKLFPGGILVCAGANSAASLRSMPARYLFLDEVDAYPGDVDGEGDPVELATARTSTFRNRKCFYVSTPTLRGASRIEAGFLQTDQRRYFMPCPECETMLVLVWSTEQLPDGVPHARIRWDSEDLACPAWAECSTNGCVIEERAKTKMLARGEWRPTVPEAESRTTRGYHLSSLYAPAGWQSWTEIRDLFLKSKDDPAKLKTFVNTRLGETWVERGDAPPWRRLYGRRELYAQGTIPMGGTLLVAGADVQKDRIEVEVRAWGPRWESWSVDYRIFHGDVVDLDSAASPWRGLEGLLAGTFPHESGAELRIAQLAVDTGFETQTVYAWVRRQDPRRVAAVKGADLSSTLLSQPSYVDVTHGGRKVRRGLRLWSVGGGVAKSELYGWLRQEPPGEHERPPTGYMHFPQYGEEYFRQLTAEELVAKQTRKGFTKYEWVKGRERNEALDCAVYGRSAAAILGIDRYGPEHWEALRAQLGLPKFAEPPPAAPATLGARPVDEPPVPEPEPPPPPPSNKPALRRRRRSSFWDR